MPASALIIGTAGHAQTASAPLLPIERGSPDMSLHGETVDALIAAFTADN